MSGPPPGVAFTRLPPCWQQAIAGYLDWLAASAASTATMRMRRHYLTRLGQAAVERGPWQLTTDDLSRFLARPGWAPETRKSVRSSVRGFYGWALDTGRVPVDPSRALPRVRIPPPAPRPVPPGVATAALRRADPRTWLMVMFALYAGLRRAEIAAVHTRDLTQDAGGDWLRVAGKGGRTRMIPLHRELAAALREQPSGWVFPGQIDGHLSPDRVGHLLTDVLGAGWSGHSCRHRFATAAYAAERDLEAVRMLLGHASPATTARYVALPEGALRAAVTGLDRQLMGYGLRVTESMQQFMGLPG